MRSNIGRWLRRSGKRLPVVFAVLGTLAVLAGSQAASGVAQDTSAARRGRERRQQEAAARRAQQAKATAKAQAKSQRPQTDDTTKQASIPIPIIPPRPQTAEQIGGPPREPKLGSAERAAIVAAVRRSVGNKTKYLIDHLRSTARWAYFSGTEILPLEGEELQETDLSVQALLELRTVDGAPRWEVVERWTLPTEDQAPRSAFLHRLRDRTTRDGVPKALFPSDLFR